MSTSAVTAPNILPRHIAIIMDGNNRYGKANNLGKGQGHIAGKTALDPIVEYCVETGIEVLTVLLSLAKIGSDHLVKLHY